MAVPIGTFDGATAAPPVANPVMISAGDSLMWGQGLLPQNRFREIVRLRLQTELGAPVTELSTARSGARCTPSAIPASSDPLDNADQGVVGSLLDPGNPSVPARYNAFGFVREIPGGTPTTLAQLQAAFGILSDPANAGDPSGVRLILLDGGINDTGIANIITPAAAIAEGGPLASWEVWLFSAAIAVRDKMIETLRFTLTNFPNAAVVVNGYFPVFSFYSSTALFRVQALAAVFFVPGAAHAFPLSIAAASSASRAWQVASNRRLRQAVATISQEFPGRIVRFARSGIEGPRCLFAPQTMLWDYDGRVDFPPVNLTDVAMILAGITPQDEVAVQRRAAVAASGITDPIVEATAIMASVGHPNVAGAQEYATSIIDALEFANFFTPSRPPCEQAAARRRRACQAARDTWDFRVMRTTVGMDAACTGAANAILGAAGAAVGVAGAAWERLTARPAAAAACYSTTGATVAACAATEATAIAACNAAFATTIAGPCAIFCTSFTGCTTSFGPLDPRRYACVAARVACVAAAAGARAACRVAAEATRAVCVAAAVAAGVACRAAAVASDTACAAGQVIAGVADLVVATGALAVALGTAIVGVGVVVACRVAQGVVGVGGRLIGWAGQRVCQLSSNIRLLGCRLAGAVASLPAATVRR